MKTKITLSIAGMLLGLVLGGGDLTAFAAEPTITSEVSITQDSPVISQKDAAVIKSALDTLQITLNQIDSSIKSGKLAAPEASKLNVALESTKENLLVLKRTLTILYPAAPNLAQAATQPTPKTQIEVGSDPNTVVEATPSKSSNEQASVSSVLNSKTAVGIVLGIALVVAVVIYLRRKPKPVVVDMEAAQSSV